MLVKEVLMEIRSRLRSCNVYMTTGVNFNKNCNLKISIQPNSIVLNYYDDENKKKIKDSLSSIESLSDCCSEDDSEGTITIQTCKFFQIIPNSMSCLKIDKNNISFRILTQPKNGGNFYRELLSENSFNNNSKVNEIKLNIKAKDKFKILCSNCSNVISDGTVAFDRILELPSVYLDMSEWFCHGHNNSSQSKALLKADKKDFLYRLTYFVVNSSVLSNQNNKFNNTRNIYHCSRCLAWLGLKESDSVNFFNSEVKVNLEANTDTTVFCFRKLAEDQPTNDFIHTIEFMIKEFDLGYQYTVMCKLVLESQISAKEKKFLLLWVMDKELQVLKNVVHTAVDKIDLQCCYLTKVLYKVEAALNDEVEAWLADPGVVITQISKLMFMRGIEHLQKMSLKIPEPFRNVNGYFVSYLKA